MRFSLDMRDKTNICSLLQLIEEINQNVGVRGLQLLHKLLVLQHRPVDPDLVNRSVLQLLGVVTVGSDQHVRDEVLLELPGHHLETNQITQLLHFEPVSQVDQLLEVKIFSGELASVDELDHGANGLVVNSFDVDLVFLSFSNQCTNNRRPNSK